MAQSSDESKMNSRYGATGTVMHPEDAAGTALDPKGTTELSGRKTAPTAISRDFTRRDFQNEKSLSEISKKEMEVQKAEEIPKEVNRREFFKSVGPASGKALTGFLRNFQWTVNAFVDNSKPKNKKSD